MAGRPDLEAVEGLTDLGVTTNLGYEKLVFFQVLTIQRAESLISRFGLQDFIESVDALYSLVYPYIVEDNITQNKLDVALKKLTTEIDTLKRGDPKFQNLASNQMYMYAKAKYRYLLEALKTNGFLPNRAASFIER